MNPQYHIINGNKFYTTEKTWDSSENAAVYSREEAENLIKNDNLNAQIIETFETTNIIREG